MFYKINFLIGIFLFFGSTETYFYINDRQRLKVVKEYLPNDPIILEAGAFDGQDSISMLHFWPNATIHSFEPVDEIYSKLVKNVSSYNQIKTYPIALGDKVGKIEIYVSEQVNNPGIASGSSSILEPKQHIEVDKTIIFPRKVNSFMITIDEWAKNNNISYIDLMWLDMQGYELNALMNAKSILHTVKAIIIEVEFIEAYKNQYQFEEIKIWLENEGFKMLALANYGWFGDAIFIRKTHLKRIKRIKNNMQYELSDYEDVNNKFGRNYY